MHCSADFRLDALREAEYNVSLVPTEKVALDLSTDVSERHRQGGRERLHDAHHDLSATIREVLGFDHWLPVHLGRGAESVIASMVAPRQSVLCNEIYVTARWSVMRAAGNVIEAAAAADASPFGGDIDLSMLEELLFSHDVAYVQITAPRTLLSRRGGRPVSLANLIGIRNVMERKSSGVPLILDASRIMENAAWIRRHEPGQQERRTSEIAREQMSLADIVFLSGRKDAGGTHGGLLLAREERFLDPLRSAALLLEGSPRTGGMSAGEMRDLVDGLVEAESGDEAARRVASLEAFASALVDSGVPVLSSGSGAIYVDAKAALPQVPASELPAQTLVNLLYLRAGIRSLGTPPDESATDEIVRLCAPCSTMQFLGEALPDIFRQIKGQRAGYRLKESRHSFHWSLSPVSSETFSSVSPTHHPPFQLSSTRGFANPAWLEMEASLRKRLALDSRWTLLPAAAERGPQRLLTEAANRLTPPLTIRAEDDLIQQLDAFWRARRLVRELSAQILHVTRLANLVDVLDRRAVGDLVAVDLGPLTGWPDQPRTSGELFEEVDILWASDPAGAENGGGFLAFARPLPLYQAIREQMLFAVGSIHDGGLSTDRMTALANTFAKS